MIVPVVQVGNSRGIRLPKNILQRLSIEEKVEINIQDDELIIKSIPKKAREGWNEAFAKIPKEKADKLLLPENIDSESFEWIW